MTKQNHKDSLNQAPDHSETALLLIDVINPMEFSGSDKLLRQAQPMADALAALKLRAKKAGIPAIYTNDNFGRWRSDFPKLVQYCLDDARPGSPIVRRLVPEPDDYFVLKPKHSAFYQTNLETLLNYLGVKTVIVTGLAGDICVLFTANDAYMRDLNVIVPPDCIASEGPKQTQLVLELMHRVLKAEIQTSTAIGLNPNGGRGKEQKRAMNRPLGEPNGMVKCSSVAGHAYQCHRRLAHCIEAKSQAPIWFLVLFRR